MIAANNDHSHVDIVQFLLDRVANVDMKSNDGVMALHDAASYWHDEIVRLFIERGANIHMKANSGRTPLDDAKQFNHPSTAAIIETTMQSIKGENNNY